MRVCVFPARANVTKMLFVPLLTVVGVDVNGSQNAGRAVQTHVFHREILSHKNDTGSEALEPQSFSQEGA